MWNEPTKTRLESIPALYTTEDISLQDKLIHLHFFIGGCDWFITEFDGDDLFWGFAILNGDLQNAEWGYISFSELKRVRVSYGVEIDCEIPEAFPVTPAKEIDLIRRANNW